MKLQGLSIIVIGGLNTDIVAVGAKKLLNKGELTYANELHIGPGGKSRNIAQMIAALSTKRNVAMVGKTSKDPFGFWKIPIKSLKNTKVNTNFINVVSYDESHQLPGVALISVDTTGKNQIYVIPGINNSFLPADIDRAESLFTMVAKNKGILILTLELPYETALYAVKRANMLGIKVILDPGGIDEGKNYSKLLSREIFLIKPNEHESKILTGITIKDFASARLAGQKLLGKGIKNVFITRGAEGGYFFSKSQERHIPVPVIDETTIKDETGCGDETTAAVTTMLNEGKDVEIALAAGIIAGTLQFHRKGINPITRNELNKYLS